MNVMFLKGTQAEYDAAQKTAYTFYYTEDTHRLYLGEVLLASQMAAIGTIESTFTGKQATITSNFTPAGTISEIVHTPAGSITVAAAAPQLGETANYTPAGEISKPGISIDSETVVIGSVKNAGELPTANLSEGTLPSATLNQGTLPSLTFDAGSFPEYKLEGKVGNIFTAEMSDSVEDLLILNMEDGEEYSLVKEVEGELPSVSFNAGTLPSLSFNAGAMPVLTFNAGQLPTIEEKTVLTGVAAALESAPKFTGTPVYIRGGFSGQKFSITPTFTGTAGTATATYTPEGDVSSFIKEEK